MANEKEEAKKEYDGLMAEIKTAEEALDEKRKVTENTLTGDEDLKPTWKQYKSALTNNPDSKVSAMSWWPKDNEHICTVLQDGKIIIHNAKVSKQSMRLFLCQQTWLMTAEFSPDGSKLAVGGLDNFLTIHEIPDLTEEGFDACPSQKFWKRCEKHGGYINTCQWIGNDKILTGAGDTQIMLWDLTTSSRTLKEPVQTFLGHSADAAALSVWDGEKDLFLSGSSDTFAKLWDMRVQTADHNGCVATFMGHEKAVSSIKKLNGIDAFITGSEDGTMRMFDIRAQQCVQTYGEVEGVAINAVDATNSSRLLVTGDNSGDVCLWDSLSGQIVQELKHHDGEISALEFSRNGHALATGCRTADSNLAIWSA